MKFSRPMIVILGIALALVVVRIITPTPEQQMMDYYNQQNQQMMEQNMQMLNGMQNQVVDPYSSGYTVPGYYQQTPGYQQMPGYQQSPGYSDGSYSYPNNDYRSLETPAEADAGITDYTAEDEGGW